MKLDVLSAPLTGSNLIEANAGTGKTYNITALFTRMLAENGYGVESILVVTYTKAAVSDLKAKIYKRLNDVLTAMSAIQTGAKAEFDDPFPTDYATERKNHLESDIKRIKNAIRDFDQCSIFTIHSFCQRMLKENAFSGHVAYDIDLTGDQSELIRRPIHDFWRMNAYGAHPAVIPILTSMARSGFTSRNNDPLGGLIDFYKEIQSNPSMDITEPEEMVAEEDIVLCEEKLREYLNNIAECYKEHGSEIRELMDTSRKDFPLKKAVYKKNLVPKSFEAIEQAIADRSFHCPQNTQSVYRFTNESIETCGGGISHRFFDLVSEWYATETEYQRLCENFRPAFLYRMCRFLDEVLEGYKQKQNRQSYDDLITRMRYAVTENSGHNGMVKSLGRKFSAALIDEFQDTDPYQYDIFHSVFAKNGKPFFMIGDPKQAIYSFRGADVYAYLKAAGDKGKKYVLTTNYRSDRALVSAVNGLFRRDNAFIIEKISYNDSDSEKELKLTIDGAVQAPMTVWNAGETRPGDIALSTAKHISELLNKSAAGNAELDGRPLRPSDIAVICRKKDEMTAVKQALSACGVPAVMSGSDSVFASDEAVDMANFLDAVVSPFNARLIKTALASPLFGYKAEQLYGITETDQWDDITEEFRKYNDLINMKGFAPMFFGMASGRRLYKHTATLPSGERKLTNYIHITELAQRFEAEKNASPADIQRWLKEKIASSATRDDEAELKMDSDENAVTIITIHKSKGLEYNVVYTPFLMFSSQHRAKTAKYHEDERFVMELSPDVTALEKSAKEQRAEDIRIAYVALTRPKAACFTAWGKGSGSEKSAMAYLINGAHTDYEEQQLKQFFAGGATAVEPLPVQDVQTYRAPASDQLTSNKTYTGTMPAPWQINSFSRLIHTTGGARDTDQFTKKADSELTNELNIFTFPKGAKAGTCLHECMEETAFHEYSKAGIAETVLSKLTSYSFDTDYTPAVTDNIYSIINKDMHGVRLTDLKDGDYVHEMEFQMATAPFRAEKLAEVFIRNGQTDYGSAAATLSFQTISGFMNGFADLIFCHGGRYYVLDWKSNHLGMTKESYTYEHMHTEMLGSHYYLQMHIYTLALHMHLKRFLPNYSYETHMGGGIYVFMRGINNDGDEGVYYHRPDGRLIEEMRELMT